MMLRFSLVVGMIVLLVDVSFAQGRRRDNQRDPIEMSQDQSLKAESTFIEAEKQMILENYTKAYDLFLLADELNPDNAAIQYKLADVMVKSGEYDRSISFIQKAIDLDGSNKYYYLFKAEILKLKNDFSGAADVYITLMETLPGNNQYLYELAGIYVFEGNWNKALETYEKIEEEFGVSYEIVKEKQKIYLRKNDMNALMRDWDTFIENHPGVPDYILEYCNVLIANDLVDDARVRLTRFKEDYPENKRVYLLLSEIERQNGDELNALRLLEDPLASQAIEIDLKIQLLDRYTSSDSPELKSLLDKMVSELVNVHPDSYQALAYSADYHLGKGNQNVALDFYLKAVAVSPGNYSVWQNIVNLEAEAGSYDSLLMHSEEALEYFPNQSIFYYYNGFANYIKENYQRAAYSLEQGKKYTSDPGLLTIFYGQLGDVYNSLNEHSKSDASYESALKNDPTNYHVLNNYSYYLSLRQVNMEKARKMAQTLVSNNPENGTYLDTYGWVLYVMEEYDEAERILKKASGLIEDGTVTEHYGDVLFKLGKIDQAIENWEKAKEQGGTSDHIDKKIADKKLYE